MLDTGDVVHVLPWVQPSHEAEVREAFDRARRVSQGGGDARALADTWFFETIARVHRAGEGAGFDGLKPAGSIDPLIAAVDQTLESGSVEAGRSFVAAYVEYMHDVERIHRAAIGTTTEGGGHAPSAAHPHEH